MIRTILLAMLAGAAAASAAQMPVAFTPEPRWREEPEAAEFCAAARRECPGAFDGDIVRGEVAYEELYDARGMLVGIRRAQGSGCAPLDDRVLLDRRDFALAFREEGEPDVAIRAELGPGSDAGSVRIVKRGTTALSIACGTPDRRPGPIQASAPVDGAEPLPTYIDNPEAEIGLTPAPEPL